MFTEKHTSARVTCTPLPEFVTSLPFPLRGGVALLRDGARMWLLTAPYSSTGRSALFLISLSDSAVEKFPLQDEGACAIAAGREGIAYIGTLTGRLLRFELATRALVEIGRLDAPLTAAVWSGDRCYFGAADGTVYGLDPDSGEVMWNFSQEGVGDVRALLETPAGRIVAVAAGEQVTLLLISPDTGAVQHRALPGVPKDICAVILPNGGLLLGSQTDGRCFRLSGKHVDELQALPNEDAFFSLGRAGDEVLATGRFTGAIYRWTPAGWEFHGTPMPNDPLHFTALSDQRIAGVTYHGRLVQSTPDLCMYAMSPLPNREPSGMHLGALGVGADRKLYFAPAAGMRVGCWDPEEDEPSELFVAAPYPGEIGVFGLAGDRLYLGFGEPCGVMCYYPELPYRLLENPKLVGQSGKGQLYPVGLMVYALGQLYFAACAGNGEGALVRIEPIADRLTTFRGVVPGQNLTGVVADRINHLLILSGRSESEEAARVACWSLDTEDTIQLATPFADAPAAYVWAAEGGRAYITDGGERLAMIDTATGKVLQTGRFPLGAITSLIATHQGELYGLAGGWLFHFDPVKGRVERLCEAVGEHLTAVRRNHFVYTREGRLYSVQVW
ncbi:MAG: outer membrane protein assembly factor BamB family protein [Armatimonadota bacterium]